jgi:hypothetical protein
MKKQILSIAAALALSLIAAGQCSAQQDAMSVNVPFAFQAGDKVMPAGEYRVGRVSLVLQAVQRIAQSDGDASIMVMTTPVVRTGKAVSPRLVFHRYGSSYFLTEIWTGETQGRQLSKSHGEKELAATIGTEEVAVLAHASSDKL